MLVEPQGIYSVSTRVTEAEARQAIAAGAHEGQFLNATSPFGPTSR